jgi:hypothetical protein
LNYKHNTNFSNKNFKVTIQLFTNFESVGGAAEAAGGTGVTAAVTGCGVAAAEADGAVPPAVWVSDTELLRVSAGVSAATSTVRVTPSCVSGKDISGYEISY